MLLSFRILHHTNNSTDTIFACQANYTTSSVIIEIGLLLGLDLADALDVVLVSETVTTSTKGVHSGFDANSLELGTVEVISGTSCINYKYTELDKVNFLVIHLPGVDFEDLHTSIFVGHGELNLSIQTTGTE